MLGSVRSVLPPPARRTLARFVAAAFAALLVHAPRRARADIPADRQALILTRALAYDNNLRARAGGAVVVAVVYRPQDGASESMAEAMYRAFKRLESVKVQDLPFRVVKIPFTGRDALDATVAQQHISTLYGCSGLDADVDAITQVARKRHVLSLAAREAYLENGFSLGLFLFGGKATITVNLAASRLEGAQLSSELLRLARLVH